MANLEDAMTVWVESQLDQGRRIPEPLSEREYSGRVTFRMPPGTHEEAARLAAVQGVSLNAGSPMPSLARSATRISE